MTKSIRLNDLQMILLSAASARLDGSLFPLPESIADDRARADKAMAPLLKRGLVAERAIAGRDNCWREKDEERMGLFITPAGIALIAPDGDSTPTGDAEIDNPDTLTALRPTKTALVLDLLRRENGASIDELVAVTGWLPHTTRATLTGLRKKGYAVVRDKIDGVTHYMIKRVAAE